MGHSLGANVALEMVAGGHFSGPLVLLSPTFSRADEATFLTIMDQVGRLPALGPMAWSAMMKAMPTLMKHELPPARADALAADLANNDPEFCRRLVHRYYAYLDRYPSLVPRLSECGVPAWVVRGDHDEIGLRDVERRALHLIPGVTLVTVPEAGHLLLVEQPARVADVVVEAARSAS
ncbi:alpha/beta fold hydrolase [Streptacidiphilus monticola]